VAEPSSQVKKGRSVLFVCTANICRSPMAAALFRSRLEKERPDWKEWRIESAGTWASDGESATKNSRLVMSQRGLDIHGHRSKTVTAEALESFDLILTMESGHKEALKVEFPSLSDRIYMLSEMEGSSDPIDDPYGQPIQAYEEAANKMDRILENGFTKIVLLAAGKGSA